MRVFYCDPGLNVHDLVPDKAGALLFVNTDYSCLTTPDEGHSFKPMWQPPFIKKLVSMDSCHLNGLAMVDGEARYMSACGQTELCKTFSRREARRIHLELGE